METLIAATYTGVGFITHEDQDTSNLRFEILTEKDGVAYVKIQGEEAAINDWQTRVSGAGVSQEAVQAIIDSLPPDPLTVLQATVDQLVIDLLGGA